jgi:Cof subfamily protein (haloacid dehalogenase superfamily)
MREIRMLSFDLDGTLLDDRGLLSEENRGVIQEYARRGVKVVLASGRMPSRIEPYAEFLEVDCAIIAYNGAMAFLPLAEKKKMILYDPLPAIVAEEVMDYCREWKFHLNFYSDGKVYVLEEHRFSRYAEIYARQTGAELTFVPDFTPFQGMAPVKLVIVMDPLHPDSRRTRDFQYNYFSEKLKGRAHVVRSNPEYLEFLSISANKGVALLRIAEYYGIAAETIMAFGDAENDREMLSYAGIGVAMANASESLRRESDAVTVMNNNNAGVANFLLEVL